MKKIIIIALTFGALALFAGRTAGASLPAAESGVWGP